MVVLGWRGDLRSRVSRSEMRTATDRSAASPAAAFDPKQTNGGAIEPHRVPFRCWMTRLSGAELEVSFGPGVEKAKKSCSQNDLHPLCESRTVKDEAVAGTGYGSRLHQNESAISASIAALNACLCPSGCIGWFDFRMISRLNGHVFGDLQRQRKLNPALKKGRVFCMCSAILCVFGMRFPGFT